MEELNISTQQYSYIIAGVFCCLYGHATGSGLCTGCAGYENRLCNVCCTVGRCSVVQPRWQVVGVAGGCSWCGPVPRGSRDDSGGSESQFRMVPGKERSIAVGYFNVGSSIGAMIAPPLVVWAIVMHSWQMAFIISGALSFIWAMAWLIFYKHPRDQKHLTDEERDYIINGQEAQHR